MKIKLILAACVFTLLSSLDSQAQHPYLEVGLNVANVSSTNSGSTYSANSLASFQVGVIGKVPIVPTFSFQPGLVFTGKGSKTQSGNTSDATYYRATSNPWYLEIPLNFVFTSPTGPIRFFAGAGPYLGIGIAGKNKVHGRYLGTTFSSDENIRWSNDDPTTLNYEEGSGYGILKRFDYGLNGLVGIRAKHTILAVNYGYGLAKLQSGTNSSANDNNKNRVWSFMLGFTF